MTPRFMQKLKFQYFSDIHLEFHDSNSFNDILRQIQPKADICVLAGDIGYPFQENYTTFLKYMNDLFKHVFLIHGNHEYYQLKENKGKSMTDIYNKTNSIIKDNNLKNIHFLYNSYYDLDRYRFYGTVLWTKITDPIYLINDEAQIKEFSFKAINKVHEQQKEKLSDAIKQADRDGKIPIIITHHIPSFELIHNKYREGNMKYYNQCYASESDDLIIPPVGCWIYGHTHSVDERILNEVPCLVNPIGYIHEMNNPDFNKVFEL